MKIVTEGELVRDWWECEYDDIEIAGRPLRGVLEGGLPYNQTDDGPSRFTQHFGRARITIEILEPPK